jgi:hypothetical protein
VTPGSVIRAIGPLGPVLINKYVGGRFSSQHGGRFSSQDGKKLEGMEVDAFRRYLYQVRSTCRLFMDL